MKTKQLSVKMATSLFALGALVFLSLNASGGSLEPSSPPGPTMKTLDEIEPGTPISSVPYIITESGSYYLSANAQMTSSLFSGITIWADNVTLDLKAFSLIGTGTAGRHGVFIDGAYENITIRNGTIRDFDNGIYESGNQGRGHQIIGVHVLSNTGSGIRVLGDNHLITDCTVSDNGTSASSDIYGIYVQHYCSVTNNKIYNNGGSASLASVEGIYVGNGCKVTGNLICNNGIGAGTVTGIHATIACTVTGNTVVSNGGSSSNVVGLWVSHSSTVTGNTVCLNGNSASGITYGILANSGSIVSNNTVSKNGNSASASGGVYGISAGFGCMVSGNVAYSNGYGASSGLPYNIYGIYANESCTVMDNTASENGGGAEGSGGPLVYGIFASAGSTVTGNTASKNATPISTAIAAGIYLGEYSLVDQNTSYDNKGLDMNNPGNCSFGVNVPQLP